MVGKIAEYYVDETALDDTLAGYRVPRKDWGSDFFRFGPILVRWDAVKAL